MGKPCSGLLGGQREFVLMDEMNEAMFKGGFVTGVWRERCGAYEIERRAGGARSQERCKATVKR
jgi:hypothetical protein